MKKPNWFQRWESNDFWHLKREVRWHSWVLLLIAASVLTNLVTRFFFG